MGPDMEVDEDPMSGASGNSLPMQLGSNTS
jgi:hypothetical protein